MGDVTKATMSMPEVKVLLNILRLSNNEAYRHSLAVASIVEGMLMQCSKYGDEEKREIVKGALLHDIGKVFVPLNLTQFPQSLDKQEFEIVKVHAAVSYEMVRPVFSETVQNICLYHHERPNGTGYLTNKVLANIPEEALIVQVADVFDALVTKRSYKHSYDESEALKIMQKESEKLMLDDEYLSMLEKCLQSQKGDFEWRYL